jgi:DEAD/DEAH box helicase domain-containing protein
VGLDEAELLPHQAEAFRLILEGRSARLKAGTASGKTLAVALPLFEKIERGEIKKIIFLYPTLALMDDQRRVMDRLKDVYGFEEDVGTIRGGMSRLRLVDALGKRVIVATPDAVYWFLRKNVKYSHLLIYGLLLADEIVVDEAHLFAGLAAQNLAAFLERLREIKSRYLGAPLRVHLLTATWPKNGMLDGLSPEAESLEGSSLVKDVRLQIRREDDPRERSEALVKEALNSLDNGSRSVLLVLNSARKAHLAFDQMTGASASARRLEEIPDEFKLRFAVVNLWEMLKVAGRLGLREPVEKVVRREVPLPLSRVKSSVAANLRGEVLAGSYGDFLERTARDLKSKVWRVARGKEKLSRAGLEIGMGAESLARLEKLGVEGFADYPSFKEALEAQVTQAQEEAEHALEAAETAEGIRLTFPEMPELKVWLENVPLLDEFARTLQHSLVLDSDSVVGDAGVPIEAYRGVSTPVSWILSWLGEAERARLEPEVLDKAEHRAVRRVKGREDGAVAVLYSGSMPRRAREGLIELFAVLRVPAVLVSTSAVEVGVDFDADALVTEKCSGSSFLQRFGRVGRRPGVEAEARLLVDAESYAILEDELGGRDRVDRAKFSEVMTQALPERLSLRESWYVEALQRAVTYQIGEVGWALGKRDDYVEDLLDELRECDVELTYGLRGTMPSVQLKEGVSKSPFYALRFASSEQILPPDSPFELARLDRAFDELIYASREDQRDIFVNFGHTWRTLRAMAYLDADTRLRVSPIPDAWLDLDGLVKTLLMIETLKRKMGSLPPVIADAIGQKAGLLPGMLTHPEVLLFYGDVALGMRASDPEMPDRVEIVPYRLQDQWMLLLPGLDVAGVAAFLADHGIADLEELYYDYDGLKHKNSLDQALGLVILEEQAGACLAAWEKIVRG